MGLLDRILNFFFPRRHVEPEEEEIEEERTGAPISRDVIYQRKIIKTGASDKRQTKTVELFAFTFEDNFTDRFKELADEIRSYADANNLFIAPDINKLLAGYDDQEEWTDPPREFIFDEDDQEGTIEVGTE